MAIHNPFKNMPKWAIYTSIAGGLLIGGFAEYKHHESTGSWSPFTSASASSSTSATTSTAVASSTAGTVTDPTTGTVYTDTAIDPVTQMTYASEISEFGSVATAEADVSEYGVSDLTGSETYDSDYVGEQSTDLTTTTSGTTDYTSNSAWSQAVQAGLEDISGTTTYDGVDIGTTLGMFLQGEPLTSAEAGLIATAEAEYGDPPQGAPAIVTVPTTTTGTTTTTPTSTAVSEYPAPTGLKVTHSSGSSYIATWSPTSPAAASYTLAVYPSAGGSEVVYQTVSAPDSTGSVTNTFSVTKAGKYNVEVWANGGTKAPPHATYAITVD